MVAFSRKQQGKGIVDTLLSPFTVEKYQGEKHARENLIGKPYSFLGQI